MLVDDHPLVRDGLRARLEAVPGFEVVAEAGNADEAHAQLEAVQPSLILMDVGMKGVNGIELTTALLERQPALLVLMLSMYDNPEYVQRAELRVRLLRVRRFADDLEPGHGLQPGAQAVAHERVVVDEQQADRGRWRRAGTGRGGCHDLIRPQRRGLRQGGS